MVYFKKASYTDENLKSQIFEMIDLIAQGLIQKGMRVLIKPNFLLPAKPEHAILTHPLIVRAVADYVLDKGAQVQISDSSAIGSFDKILKEGGYVKAFEGLDVEFKPFKSAVKVDIGSPFGQIEIAQDALESDVVINLPKLKTHTQMLLTLGVKNLFGCIVGFKKSEWHLRTGVDRDMFAELLVRIHRAVNPSLTIIDGILALEGQGPGKSGTPRHIGVLVGSRSAYEADAAITRMFGIAPDSLPTHQAAKKLNMVDDRVEIIGDFQRISGFKLPELVQLTFGPKRFQGFMRKHLLQRPVPDALVCRLCGECSRHCPAKAIIQTREGKIAFDYDRCIRCYCCIEICPYGALLAEETGPGKLIRRLTFSPFV